jgi:hypothetical protein
MDEKGERPQGPIIEYNPYRPPKKRHGEGKWTVESRHFDKNYPLSWRWVPKGNLDEGPNMSPVEGTVTKEQLDKALAERMAKAWDANTDKDGRGPIGGAQD